MKHFHQYIKADILKRTRVTRFITRIGERVQTASSTGVISDIILSSSAKYVMFGIPEDIGVRANKGIGGTDTVWPQFLDAFLNLQSNELFSGEELLLLGAYNFQDLRFVIEEKAGDENEKTDAYRRAVGTIDEEVEQLTRMITASGKIPIAIGGGHNNAYPLIKGAAKGWFKKGDIRVPNVSVINLDAHTDLRAMEGRHSGNGFSYAREDGYLHKYFILGVQETHLPQTVLMDIAEDPNVSYATYEDIFIHEKQNFNQALFSAIEFAGDNRTGIELDLDCMENILTATVTPSGLSSQQARQFVSILSARCIPAYLHICEGAAMLEDGRKSELTGKLIAYLVSDFIKSGS